MNTKQTWGKLEKVHHPWQNAGGDGESQFRNKRGVVRLGPGTSAAKDRDGGEDNGGKSSQGAPVSRKKKTASWGTLPKTKKKKRSEKGHTHREGSWGKKGNGKGRCRSFWGNA